MKIPSGPDLVLHDGILPERGAEADRLVLWLCGRLEDGFQHWERVSSVPRATVAVEHDLCTVPAIGMNARQRIRGFLGKLISGQRRRAHEWRLPNGAAAEEYGERQADLILVWPVNPADALDVTNLRLRWPEAKRLQQLGRNLFLVSAVRSIPPPPKQETELPVPPPSSPCQLRRPAEQRLVLARQAGDARAIATALTDLGIVVLRQEDPYRAVPLLEEALPLVRQIGDRSWECDVLSNLGLALLAVGQVPRAQELFQEEHALAQTAGDLFAKKIALDNLAQAAADLRDFASALTFTEQALAIAGELGDRRHEADLCWFAALQHAEAGERDRAIQMAQAAVAIMEKIKKPHAAWFADHLRRYREEADVILTKIPVSAVPQAPVTFVASAWPTPAPENQGPGLLRMAKSATQAMLAFLGSGFQTVPVATQQQRLKVCTDCEHHTGLRCRLCGCFTGAKSRLPFERCPVGKWPASPD
jgi:tetratricopeptide (TPR) repeat protein